MEGIHSMSLNDIKGIAASQEIDMDARNRHRWSPLMIACASDDEDMVKFFLDHGADPNARCTETGNTPMHFATVNKACGFFLYGKTCNFSACHKKSRIHIRKAILRLLICHGATLQRNSLGLNPPCLAALHKLTGIVNFFTQGSEHTCGLQLSIAEEVEAYEFLGIALGLSDSDLYAFRMDGIVYPYLFLYRAVSLCEKSGIPSYRDHEWSEIAARFSIFSTKECKTQNDWGAIKQDHLAVKIQCFLVADRVIPERIKKSYLNTQLLTHAFDGIFASQSIMDGLEGLREGSQIFREAIEWELQSKLKLGTVFRKILRGIELIVDYNKFSPMCENKSVRECYELMGLCSQMFGEVSKQRLHKYSAALMSHLGSFLEHVALSNNYKSKEMCESLIQISERIAGVLQRRCGRNTPSVTHLFLEYNTDSLSDISKSRKAKENLVKHLLYRLLQFEDAPRVSLGNSMLHSLIEGIHSYKDLQFLKDTALILIRNGCSIEARNVYGKTAKEILCRKGCFNPDTPEIEELMSLISPPTSVLSLEEIAARTILRHKIPYEGVVPRHLSAIVRGDLEPDSEFFPHYDLNELSSDSELDSLL